MSRIKRGWDAGDCGQTRRLVLPTASPHAAARDFGPTSP